MVLACVAGVQREGRRESENSCVECEARDPNDRASRSLHTSSTNFNFPLSLPFVRRPRRPSWGICATKRCRDLNNVPFNYDLYGIVAKLVELHVFQFPFFFKFDAYDAFVVINKQWRYS